jgi:hypothetical protein
VLSLLIAEIKRIAVVNQPTLIVVQETQLGFVGRLAPFGMDKLVRIKLITEVVEPVIAAFNPNATLVGINDLAAAQLLFDILLFLG